jgi:hypothetical protein
MVVIEGVSDELICVLPLIRLRVALRRLRNRHNPRLAIRRDPLAREHLIQLVVGGSLDGFIGLAGVQVGDQAGPGVGVRLRRRVGALPRTAPRNVLGVRRRTAERLMLPVRLRPCLPPVP